MKEVQIYSHPGCGYCHRAKYLLDEKGIQYEEINLAIQTNRFEEMIERTGRKSLPQIIINDQPIGGFDDLSALNATGDLDIMLNAA